MRALILACIVLIAAAQQLDYFPNKKGKACSKFAEECYPCTGGYTNPSGLSQTVCGCETGQCLCSVAIDPLSKHFGNFSVCKFTSLGAYDPNSQTAYRCALPENPSGKPKSFCVADNDCVGLQCRMDASGAAKSSECGTVGYPGDKCDPAAHAGQCRGSSPYTYSPCNAETKKCSGAALGGACCLGDDASILVGSTNCVSAGKRVPGCDVGLFCNVTALNTIGTCVKARTVEVYNHKTNVTDYTKCISSILDPQQCAGQRICTNAARLNTPAWTKGARTFGPEFLNPDLPYPYSGGGALKNPSLGTCVPAGNLTLGDTCGTGQGVGVLCGPANHGDTTCDNGVCRFITNSSECVSDANCGFFGICACQNGVNGNASVASQCTGIADVGTCRDEFKSLLTCVTSKNCATSSYDGTMPWLQSPVMMAAENRTCFGGCKKFYQNFACCRGFKQDCIHVDPDVSAIITGVIAFVVLVAVSIVLLLEIPQDYLPWVWLSLCWWHMWRDDIERFILERDSITQFGTGDRQREAIALFAPKDGTPKCSCCKQ